MSGGGSPDFFYREAQRLGYVARSAFKLLQLQKQFKLIGAGASVLDLGCAPGAWLQVACQSLGPLEKGGAVVGVDIKKVKVPAHHCDSRVRTVCADVMKLAKSQAWELSPQFSAMDLCLSAYYVHDATTQFMNKSLEGFQGKGFSVILSDMCPVVTGITTRDTAISCELGKRALSLAVSRAKVPGSADKNNLEDFLDSSEPDANEDGILRRGGNLVIKLLESEDNQEFINFCKQRFQKVTWSRPKATRPCSREIYLVCQGLR